MNLQFRAGSSSFHRLLCALLFLSLIQGTFRAQGQKETAVSVADNTYGDGGLKYTTSDEKFRLLREEWLDKKGKVRERHGIDYDSAKMPNSEWWIFLKEDGKTVAFISFVRRDRDAWFLEQNGSSPGISAEVTSASGVLTRDAIAKEIAAIEKQFAKDGMLPPDAFKTKDTEVKIKVEQPALPKDEVFTKTSPVDACLVGTWECKSFKEGNRFFTGGGTGFRVTFNKDGTETIDYSSMQPTKAGPIDTIAFTGTASARISTLNGVAKIESMQKAGVMMTVDSTGRHFTEKIPSLGPGGLGSADNSSYTCSGDSLEYQTSTRLDRHANCTVKLTRVKQEEKK